MTSVSSVYCATLGKWFHDSSCVVEIPPVTQTASDNQVLDNQRIDNSQAQLSNNQTTQPPSTPTRIPNTPIISSLSSSLTDQINSAIRRILPSYISQTPSTQNVSPSSPLFSQSSVTHDFLSNQVSSIGDSTGRSIASVSTSLGDRITALNTSNISEGTNLYYTDARVGSYISASSTLSGSTNYWQKGGSTLSYSLGNVGIGTTVPQSLLHIASSISGVGNNLRLQNMNANSGNTDSANIDFAISQVITSPVLARIQAQRTNRAVSGDTDLVFSNYTNGALTEVLRIYDYGSVKSLNIITNTNIKTVFEGDSLTDTTYGQTSWPTELRSINYEIGQSDWYNIAHAGRMTADMVAQYTSSAHPHRPIKNGEKGYFFIWGGTNDLRNSVPMATTYINLKTEWASARADGFKVIAFTIMGGSEYSASPTLDANRIALNNLILSDSTLYDYIIRPDLLITYPTYFDGTGMHLTTAGSNYLGDNVNINLSGKTFSNLMNYVTSTNSATYGYGVFNNISNSTQIGASDSAKLTILSSGYFGFGTTAPGTNLEVAGASAPTVFIHNNVSAAGSANLDMSVSAATHATVTHRISAIRNAEGLHSMAFSVFDGSGLTEKMRILGNGSVGIGTTSPSSKLTVNGTSYFAGAMLATSSVTFTGLSTNAVASALCIDSNGLISTASVAACSGVSSQRFKHDMLDTNLGLSTILNLHPVSFRYNQGFGDSGKDQQFGLVAEEVQKIDSRLIILDSGGLPTAVRYDFLPTILVKAVQELSAKIDNFVTQGIATIKNMVVDSITAAVGNFKQVNSDEVKASKICAGETCVTEVQLKTLLQNANLSATLPDVTPTPSATPVPTPTPEVSPTPTPTPAGQDSTSGNIGTGTPTPTPSPEAQSEASPTPTPTPTPSATPVPTPTPEVSLTPTPTPAGQDSTSGNIGTGTPTPTVAPDTEIPATP